MDYEANYNEYIDYVKTLNREREGETLYEFHHIIPKSLGGGDDKENLVLLTYREHYLAHYLLWKIYNNKEMMFSFWLMNNTKDKINFKINSKIYSKLKSNFIEQQSKKVVCLETGKIYNSQLEAARDNDLSDGWSIRRSIRNKNILANNCHWEDFESGVSYRENTYFGRTNFLLIRLEDLKTYVSYKEASLDNNKSISTICDAVNGKTKTANGYHWAKYDPLVDYKKNKFYKQKRMNNPTNYRKVVCLETGKIYNSQSEAARDIGYKISGDIGRCCDGKLKSCGGYHWRRYED